MFDLQEKGFTIIDNIFSEEEVNRITAKIAGTAEEATGITRALAPTQATGPAFRQTADLFAIRQVLTAVPGIQPLVFTTRLNNIIHQVFGPDYFAVKSIYFDKPQVSNWFVAWHQDLTIGVDRRVDLPGFGPWTVKQNQFGVVPPLALLENIFTIRIHLDDTDENNGALKVIPGSHRKGIYRPEPIDWTREKEEICRVKRGGVMLMRPLLMHASGRTVNGNRRRVLHIEFSNQSLPDGLSWAETGFISPKTNETNPL